MAVIKTTALPVGIAPGPLDPFVSVQGGATVQVTSTQLRQYVTSAPAFNANLAPDLNVAQLYKMAALTGAVAVAAPLNPAFGLELIFQWQQDATGGRVVTYNAVFKQGGATAFLTTLSTITIDRFIYDGAAWRILSRITGQAI